MKKQIIIANWKMNLGFKQSKILTNDIINGLKKVKNLNKIDVVLCPSFAVLNEIKKLIEKTKVNIDLGAQDCFWEDYGAFTGEISSMTLNEIGCKYVIIGHSERRRYLNETDKMIHDKLRVSLINGLIPIICLGETFEERQKGLKEITVINQLSKALEGVKLKAKQKLIVAYEPVWVIGSGRAINQKEAKYMKQVIKQRLIDLYPLPIIRNNIRIIYGGSVDSQSIRNFIDSELYDGVLVGGASLNADEFIKMTKKII